MSEIFTLDVLSAMVRVATPILLAALGGLMCHKAGLVNIAMEGLSLMGAFGAVAFVQFSGGSVWIGYIGAILFSTLMSLLMAVMILKLNSDQIITSIGVNLLSAGLTAFLLRAMFNSKGSFTPSVINKIPPVTIPVIKDIPVLSQLLSGHYVLVYVAIVMVIVQTIILEKTSYGLNLCSVGESQDAARTAGLNVKRIQLGALLWSGVLCGLAGAYLSTSMVSGFTEGMVSGRGFTAFTAIAFADGNPIVTALASLLFGLAEGLGIRLELTATGLSTSIIQMFPYILALIVLTISAYYQALRLRRQTAKLGGQKKKKISA